MRETIGVSPDVGLSLRTQQALGIGSKKTKLASLLAEARVFGELGLTRFELKVRDRAAKMQKEIAAEGGSSTEVV